jgi:hypothetical protein
MHYDALPADRDLAMPLGLPGLALLLSLRDADDLDRQRQDRVGVRQLLRAARLTSPTVADLTSSFARWRA